MPLVLKTLKTFFPAKMRNHYYRIHTPKPACPKTHTPLRYAYGTCGSHAAPPPWDPPSRAANPPPPPHPPAAPPSPGPSSPRKFRQIAGGWVASGVTVVAPRAPQKHTGKVWVIAVNCAATCVHDRTVYITKLLYKLCRHVYLGPSGQFTKGCHRIFHCKRAS